MTEDELNLLMENYETADLLAVVNHAPLRLNDKVFELHNYTMRVCNDGDAAYAERMFDLAEELELELFEEVEKLKYLYSLVTKLLDLRPDSQSD
jgi:hypothetical protein